MKDIVVTGLGIVSSLGFEKEEFISNLNNGISGISKVSLFETKEFRTDQGGEINGIEDHPFYDSNISNDRAIKHLYAAANQAISDANIDLKDLEIRNNTSICIGTTAGPEESLRKCINHYYYGQELEGDYQKNIYYGILSRIISESLNICGFSGVLSTVCASGGHAIALGHLLLRSNLAKYVVVGGVDALNPLIFSGFNALRAVSPTGICSPFSKNRKGLILGEGAGVLVLETVETAIKRKANIYAKIKGFGISCDAKHIAIPDQEGIGAYLAMKNALVNSKILYKNIDYVNAHGTGTYPNDFAETLAIKKIFKKHAYTIPISSIKSMIGHTMGAAGALEAIACILAMNKSTLPPTINYSERDPYCDLDYIPNKCRKAKINAIMSNSFGFAGNNVALIIEKFSSYS